MRRTILLLVGVLLSPVALGSDSPKEYDETVKVDELEGTWRFVASEGNCLPADSEREIICHSGKWMETRVSDKTNESNWTNCLHPKGFYRIDTRQLPAWLDRTTVNKFSGEFDWKGIYKIEGDLLKIARYPRENERPHSFDTKGDWRLFVVTYRRVK